MQPSVRLLVLWAVYRGLGSANSAYLTVMDVQKEHIRTQGVIYGIGALALTFSHLSTGILNLNTLIYSAILVPAAILGMRLGRIIKTELIKVSL